MSTSPRLPMYIEILALVAAMATENRNPIHAKYRADKIKLIYKGINNEKTLEEQLSVLDANGKAFFNDIMIWLD